MIIQEARLFNKVKFEGQGESPCTRNSLGKLPILYSSYNIFEPLRIATINLKNVVLQTQDQATGRMESRGILLKHPLLQLCEITFMYLHPLKIESAGSV